MRVITITGYRRPHLFRILLDSLLANDLRGWTIHIQFEPGDRTDELCRIAAELLNEVPHSLHVNSRVLGIRETPYQLLSRTFDEGAELVLYLEEDFLLARDTTLLAIWYAENHKPEWMCLSLLSGGCGSAGFISDTQHIDLLFPGKWRALIRMGCKNLGIRGVPPFNLFEAPTGNNRSPAICPQ